MDTQIIYTIGYGKREIDELIGVLKEHGINYLVDVRSAPYSKFKPEFSREALDAVLRRNDIRYEYMGDLLGGRPKDDECYVDGKVDYALQMNTAPFIKGISLLCNECEQPQVVCLMCSEGRPEECHRSKLLGVALEAEGIKVQHIDAEGNLQSQQAILHILSGGQMPLFEEQLTSRKRYRVDSTRPVPLDRER